LIRGGYNAECVSIKHSSRRPAIPKPAKVCGFCKPEFFPSPEERGYRERWSPFKVVRGRGMFEKTFFVSFFEERYLGVLGGSPYISPPIINFHTGTTGIPCSVPSSS
jgi:hypothetical protein